MSDCCAFILLYHAKNKLYFLWYYDICHFCTRPTCWVWFLYCLGSLKGERNQLMIWGFTEWQPPCLVGNLKSIRYKRALTSALVKFSLKKSYFHFFISSKFRKTPNHQLVSFSFKSKYHVYNHFEKLFMQCYLKIKKMQSIIHNSVKTTNLWGSKEYLFPKSNKLKDVSPTHPPIAFFII